MRTFIRNGIRLIMLSMLLAGNLPAALGAQTTLRLMRSTFLQAEQYIKQGRDDDYFALAATLKAYPLYPYLQYQWLVKHLDDKKSVQTFLFDHPDSRYAGLLHRKWMTHLAQQQQWLAFVSHYKASDDSELECYFAQAQYHTDQPQNALDAAERLWRTGRTLPTACDGLFDIFKQSSAFGPKQIWERFHAAMAANNVALAKSLLPLFNNKDADVANLWLKLQQNPQKIKHVASWKKAGSQAGSLIAYAISRWLETDPQAALTQWNELKKQIKLPAELIADTEKRLGMALAFRHDARAYAKLSQFAGDDLVAQEWRIRAALSQQDWPGVLAAIAALKPDDRNQDKWQYWQARALQESKQNQQAEAVFNNIAAHRSFYGFLAAEHVNKAIDLGHQPLSADDEALRILENSTEFAAVKELLAIDRRPEAIRQWWYAIAAFDNRQLGIAAKLAQRWQWPSMAIFTAAKGNLWDDIELRFPLQHQATINTHAGSYQLDPALVLALIRQESAFDSFAGSAAGAIGLMQVMPKTAREISNELGQNWHNDYNLLDPDINIRYGSYYFKRVMEQFNGHTVLATAAYNAGPHRVRQWLPQRQALPADIWIETIPYKETRSYVASVMMYSMIYQKRLGKNNLTLADLLQKIPPG